MLKIGAVSYLNTKPLVYGLPERLRAIDSSASLIFDLPSRLADALAAGRLDVALIPVVEYFRGRDYRIVSDAAIACRGPVWSVRLLSRKPISEIRTLAMDEGSRTSQALVRVLLWEQFRLRPTLVPFPIEQRAETIDADALLMIGDRAMHPPPGVYREIWDLGDRWCRWTELPFVFAVWAARGDLSRRGYDYASISAALRASRDEGLGAIEQISAGHAGPMGLTVSDCTAYFVRHLHFTLGAGELRGLDRFRTSADRLGLLGPHPATVRIADDVTDFPNPI
jgi:chorismate dehydratase